MAYLGQFSVTAFRTRQQDGSAPPLFLCCKAGVGVLSFYGIFLFPLRVFHMPHTAPGDIETDQTRRKDLSTPSPIRRTGSLYCGAASCAWTWTGLIILALPFRIHWSRKRNRPAPNRHRHTPPCLARRRPRLSVRRRSSLKACARMVRG